MIENKDLSPAESDGGNTEKGSVEIGTGAWEIPYLALKAFFDAHPLPDDWPIVVALSGWPDSVALLLCCVERFGADRIVAAHFDHSLRGTESDGDARFCERLSDRLGVRFRMEKSDVGQEARIRKTGTEDAARNLRYAFLHGVSDEFGARAVLTGHTADDFAETVLMNFLRGSKLRGLSGIPETSANGLTRPFLRVRKSDILAYLARSKEPFRTDSSNSDESYLRNAVRIGIVPRILEFNPAFAKSMRRFGEYAAELDGFIEDTVNAFLKDSKASGSMRVGDGFFGTFEGDEFVKLSTFLQKEILARLYRNANGTGVGLSEGMVAEMLRFCGRRDGGKSKNFGRLELSRFRGKITYRRIG